MRLTRVLLWALLALLTGAIALPIASLFAPFATFRANQLSASLWVAAGLCFVSLTCASAYERGKLRRLMISGLIAASVAAVIWTGALWIGTLSDDAWWTVAAVATPFSGWVVLMMLLGVLWTQPARTKLALVMRAVAAAFASLLILSIVGAICLYPVASFFVTAPSRYGYEEDYGERSLRICGSIAILYALSLLGFALSIWLPALLSGDASASVPKVPLLVRCPRCGQRQQLVTGGDQCRECSLRITVTPT